MNITIVAVCLSLLLSIFDEGCSVAEPAVSEAEAACNASDSGEYIRSDPILSVCLVPALS